MVCNRACASAPIFTTSAPALSTVKYMTAMEVDEGVARWLGEIEEGGGGEVTFPGHPGRAVTVREPNGFKLVTPDIPSFDATQSRLFYLGTMLENRRGRSMRTRTSIDARVTPFADEFRVGGESAIPVSLLLEYAVALGVEIVPDNWPVLHLSEMRNASFDLQSLIYRDSTFEFERDAVGRWQGDRWVVDVKFSAPQAHRPFGHIALVFERGEAAASGQPSAPGAVATGPLSIDHARGLGWTHAVLEPGEWGRTASGDMVATVRPPCDADLWALPYAPHASLPVALIEAALRARASQETLIGPAAHVSFERLRIVSQARALRMIGARDGTSFTFLDERSCSTHVLDQLTVHAESPHNGETMVHRIGASNAA
jgi:hypothetical protein